MRRPGRALWFIGWLIVAIALGGCGGHDREFADCETALRQFIQALDRDDPATAAALISLEWAAQVSMTPTQGVAQLRPVLQGAQVTVKDRQWLATGIVRLYFNTSLPTGQPRAFWMNFMKEGHDWRIVQLAELDRVLP